MAHLDDDDVPFFMLGYGYVQTCGGVGGVMFTIIGNRYGDPSSNPGWDCLHFT